MSRFFKAQILCLLSSLLVSTSFPVVERIAPQMDSLSLTLIRFILAAGCFAPWVFYKYGWHLPDRRHFLGYSILGGCLSFFFFCMFAALKTTSAVECASIFTITPIVTALFSFALLGQRFSIGYVGVLLLGIFGALLVISRGNLADFGEFGLTFGNMIFALGTLAMGIYGPLIKKFHRGEPMAVMTLWTIIFACGWLLLFHAPTLEALDASSIQIEVFFGVLYLAIFTTVVTFFLTQWCTKIIGPTRVMSFTYLNPILVLGWGMALHDDIYPDITYIGVGITLLATFGLQALAQQKPQPDALSNDVAHR